MTSVVTTDSAGRLTFGETEAGNAPVFNGFEIAAVPEPGAVSLLLVGLTTLVTIGRFRNQGSTTKS